jgi:PAS domain-containing protein
MHTAGCSQATTGLKKPSEEPFPASLIADSSKSLVYAIGAAFEGRGAEVGYRTSLGSPEATRYLANSAPVPIWVSNTGGARAFANQAYLRFLGVNYDEALVFD